MDSLMPGVVADPFGEREAKVTSMFNSICIGRTNLLLVNEGDVLFHVVRFERVLEAVNKVDEFNEEHSPEVMPSPHTESLII